MQSRTRVLSVFTLGAAVSFGIAASAADLPKQGTYSFTYTSFGTFKTTQVGKHRVVGTFDENGVSLGSGFGDHVTWHCFGLFDVTDGMAQHRGYCVGTDATGDQLAADVASNGKYAEDAQTYSGTLTFTAGTGKYAGISGGHTYVTHATALRAPTAGTYFRYTTNQDGSYKLP
jgi:hypothetical protein